MALAHAVPVQTTPIQCGAIGTSFLTLLTVSTRRIHAFIQIPDERARRTSYRTALPVSQREPRILRRCAPLPACLGCSEHPPVGVLVQSQRQSTPRLGDDPSRLAHPAPSQLWLKPDLEQLLLDILLLRELAEPAREPESEYVLHRG
eukprot:m.342105 g.342105  ORF g.342105 m.342105 type:complete len:147 (-) comp16545_c0_seq67:5598-6038(-)